MPDRLQKMSKDFRVEQHLVDAHLMIYAHGLVTWTSGNISCQIGPHEVIIKPSAVPYPALNPGNMVHVDMNGRVLDGQVEKPSTDVFAHCAIYREWKDELHPIRAIVHTHSPYATAFAARGLPIPCALTAIADEFGGEIPVADYATIGGEQIATSVMDVLKRRFCSAVLLKSHGVFTVGASIDSAVKAAFMVEDCARTVWLAMQLNYDWGLATLPPDEIALAHHRYKTSYGQT
jgi:L-ribulose-5-phosphate 4-epimerase